MAINTSAIATQDITQHNTDWAVEILTTMPAPGGVFTPSRTPGQIVAFFNGSTSSFELYIVSSAGNRFYKVVS
jgi:hypothetical protein